MNWIGYRTGIADDAFAVPLQQFSFLLRFAPVFVSPAQIEALSQLILPIVYQSLNETTSDLGGVRPRLNSKPIGSIEGDELESYISIFNGDPVLDFHLALSPSTLSLAKHKTSMENLISSVDLFKTMIDRLLSEVNLNALFFQGIFGFGFSFQYKLSLTGRHTHKTDIPSNSEIITKLIKLDPKANDPLGRLQPEKITRADLTFGFSKRLRDTMRVIFVEISAPYNSRQRDVDVRVELQSGTQGSSADEVIGDLKSGLWEEAFELFLKEVVLNQLLPDIFHDMKFIHRLS